MRRYQHIYNIPITNELILEQAKYLSTKLNVPIFNPMTDEESDHETFLRNFKRKYCVSCTILHGEGGSCDVESVEEEVKEIKEKLKKYDKRHVFNFDEYGLNYQLLPNHTYFLEEEEKKKEMKGSKTMHSKERISVGGCCNAAGDIKMKNLLIGKSQHPRAFPKNLSRLPVLYKNQINSTMDTEIFNIWFNEIFVKEINEKLSGENVVLLYDHHGTHVVHHIPDNVEIIPIPKNCTSRHQPLDMGIINATKKKTL